MMFSLTAEERRVVIFLATVSLIGMGVNFLLKTNVKAKNIAAFAQDLGKINLNQADKEMLMNIPGVGEKLAGRIMQYRNEHGSFYDIEELKNVKGLNSYRYEKIKRLVIIDK